MGACSRLGAYYTFSFAVHCEKISNHLRETATSSAKIHSLANTLRIFAHKSEYKRINVWLIILRLSRNATELQTVS